MRLTYISYLRVMSMLMVVLYHCLCYYGVWGYDDAVTVSAYTCFARFLNYIDMPMFIFISGFLYAHVLKWGGYNNLWDFIRNKCKRLLVPFGFWAVIVSVFISNKSFSDFLICGASHLWFLGTLFFQFGIFHFTKNVWTGFSEKKERLVFTIMLVLSVALIKVPSNPGFIIYQTFGYMYVFYAGIIVCMRGMSMSRALSYKQTLLSLLILFCLSCSDFQLGKYIMKSLSLWVVVSIFMYAQTLYLRDNSIVRTLDSCSMGIYLLHHVILQYVLSYSMTHTYMNENLWLPFATFPVVLLLSLLMTLFMHRIPYLKSVVG